MTSIASIRVHPDNLAARLGARSTEPPAPASGISALPKQSLQPAQPLVGADQHETPDNASFKHLLAQRKLLAALVCAGLQSTLEVAEYVARASHWIQATVQALNSSDQAVAFNGYQRYELNRLLADMACRQPSIIEQPPQTIADHLNAREAGRAVSVEPAHDWRSLGRDTDTHLALQRALGLIMETAASCHFKRDVKTIMTDAGDALRAMATQHTQAMIDQGQASTDDRHSLYLHHLALGGRLYAATLRRLHTDSAQMLAAFKASCAKGDQPRQQALAKAYAANHLGYEGLQHHFQQALAAISQVVERLDKPTTAIHKAQPETPAPLCSS